MINGIILIPLLISTSLCIEDSVSGYGDDMAKAELIASLMFMSGIITLLQTTLGCRWVSVLLVVLPQF